MKKLLGIVVLMTMAMSSMAMAQPCHRGSFNVKSCADLEAMQDETCIMGSVWIEGQLTLCGKNFTELSLPNLVRVRGVIVIAGNPKLNRIDAPNLMQAYGVIIQQNPMLPQCYAVDIGIDSGAKDEDRYIGQLNSGECDYE